jgi:hypothetical protein
MNAGPRRLFLEDEETGEHFVITTRVRATREVRTNGAELYETS